MTDSSLDEDTREVWCPRCGRRLTGQSEVCPSCGARPRTTSSGAAASNQSESQPDSRDSSSGAPTDLEQLVAAGKHERRQLLKHLIAKGDELDGLQNELTTLRAEHESLKARVAAGGIDGGAKSARPTAARPAIGLAGMAAVAALSIGLFEAAVARPARGRLAMQSADLYAQLQEATATTEKLRNDLAVKEQLLNARPPAGGNDPRPPDDKPPVSDLSKERKDLTDRLAAVDEEGRRLAQFKRELDLERQKQGESKKALDDERAALQRRSAALTQSANAAMPDGVLAWRADVIVPTAVLITGNKANFGTVTGAMPARPATMKLDVIEGDVKVIDGPGPKNDWNQLYLQVLGKGRVTVFLLWVAR